MTRELFGNFSISSWGVYEHFSEKEYREAINMVCDPIPNRMGHSPKLHQLIIPKNILQHNCKIIRAREHEWTHFRQHISTELGIFTHRLVTAQEWAASEYFKHLNTSNIDYTNVPFLVRFHSLASRKNSLNQAEKYELAFLNFWQLSDIMQGVLWVKKMNMKDLIYVWNSIIKTLPNIQKDFLLNNHSECNLRTRRSLDDESCPDGSITIQALVEGFAKYKEFYGLASLFGVEIAFETIEPSLLDIYKTASDFIEYYLDIPFYHPLSGALIEVALLCFRDPFLGKETEVLYWEDIHPGFRFQEAVLQLAKRIRSIPNNSSDCYDMAIEAYKLSNDYPPFRNWLDISDLKYIPFRKLKIEKDISPSQILKIGHEFLETMFISASQLRKDYPIIFFEHSTAPFEVQQNYAAVTRPPLIIGPKSIEICKGAERDTSIGILTLKAAIHASILNELPREATLSNCVELANKSITSYPSTIIKTMWTDLRKDVESVCGKCIQLYIDEIL